MTTEMTIINEYSLVNKEYQEKMWVTFKDIDWNFLIQQKYLQ